MIKKQLFILSLGGSVIIPDEIDTKFLNNFKKLILEQINIGHKFIIITGGGMVCRKYQQALKLLSQPKNNDLDWLGIQSTWLNAKLVQLMFGEFAHNRLVSNPNVKIPTNKKILLAGGWMPGCSTDKDAILMAKTYGAKTVINLSNIDFLYNKDPRKFKDAKKITKLSWTELLKITGAKWTPGANLPFDPIAGKLAKKENIKVIIANGKNLKNLKNILENKEFIGSIIE